jgi:hypothetical protein
VTIEETNGIAPSDQTCAALPVAIRATAKRSALCNRDRHRDDEHVERGHHAIGSYVPKLHTFPSGSFAV